MADPSETTQVGSAPVTDGAAEDGATEVLSAIRDLSAQVGDLQAEVETIRAQGRVLPPAERDAPGWEDRRWDDPRLPAASLTWIETLEAPSARMSNVPRLLLEVVFLVAVAVGAAVAELEAVEIVAVMAVSWALVAVAEVAAARAERRRAEAVYGPYPLVSGYPSDASWFAPPVERAVERTVLDITPDEGPPPPAKLPPPNDD